MAQELNELPVRHGFASRTTQTVGESAGKGLKYGLVALGIMLIGVPLGVGVLAGVATAAELGTLAAVGIGAASTLATGLFTWTVGGGLSAFAAVTSGLFGAAKGMGRGNQRALEQTAAANVMDAQLQMAGLEAQTRMADAQARIVEAQARMQHGHGNMGHHHARAQNRAPAHEHAAQLQADLTGPVPSASIQASNDNEVHGTVAQQQQLARA